MNGTILRMILNWLQWGLCRRFGGITCMVQEFELLEQFRDMSLVYELAPQRVMLGMLKINNEFLSSIREAQKIDVKLVDLMNEAEDSDFKIDAQGVLRFRDRI